MNDRNFQSGQGPVVVVGLPRSGSTLLTRIMNESPDMFIVNDLYYLQEVASIGAFDGLDQGKLAHLTAFLVSKLRKRSAGSSKRELVKSLLLSERHLAKTERYARSFSPADADWATLLEKVLSFAARLEGKAVWGYNTPQDYLHIHCLRSAYPSVRFIFLMRDPADTLLSYKNVGDVGNDPRRYHPVIQALSWRLCARAYTEHRKSSRGHMLVVKYEDLINSTKATLEKISAFLEMTLPTVDLASLGSNTSHRTGVKSVMTNTELWLSDLVTGSLKEQLGYRHGGYRPRLADTGELVRLTLTCMWFYLSRVLKSANVRSRLRSAARSVLGNSS